MSELSVGLVFIAAGWLNWRFAGWITASIAGPERARRQNARWFGPKIGGTAFLLLIGVLSVVGGVLRLV